MTIGYTEFIEIRRRDAESAATWFTGPASFTAQAARDRRALLAEVDRLILLVRQKHGELVLAGVEPLPHPCNVKGDAPK